MDLLHRALTWMKGPQTQPSGIDRRRFLQILGATAAGAAIAPMLDVDKLLWTPGQLVTVDGLTGNTFLTPQWVAMEALRVLEDNLAFANVINRRYSDHVFGEEGARLGSTVRVRRPSRFTTVGGEAIVLAHQEGAQTRVPDEDKAGMDRRAFSREVIQPAVNLLTKRVTANAHGAPVVFGDLALPTGGLVDGATARSETAAIRVVKDYDVRFGEERYRFDVLHGSRS